MFEFWRRLLRKHLLEEPFPESYRSAIRRSVPLAAYLSESELHKLEGLVRIMISEKNFEGAGGLELTEEMCVTIAARACLLVLHRVELDGVLYPGLESIVVYPGNYRSRAVDHEGPVVIEGGRELLERQTV